MPGNVPLAAECLVAVTGVFPDTPIRVMDVDAAKALLRKWQSLVRAFFEADRPAKITRSAKVRYLATWKKLNEKPNDAKIIAKLDDPGVAVTYTAKLTAARDYLHAQWNPLKLQGFFSSTLMDPAPSEQERCSDLFAVINGPTALLTRLSQGSVLIAERDGVKTAFPELWGMIGALIHAETYRQRAAKQSWEPLYWQQVALRALLEIPSGTIEPVKAVSPETPGEPNEPPKVDIGVKSDTPLQTKTDRIGDATP